MSNLSYIVARPSGQCVTGPRTIALTAARADRDPHFVPRQHPVPAGCHEDEVIIPEETGPRLPREGARCGIEARPGRKWPQFSQRAKVSTIRGPASGWQLQLEAIELFEVCHKLIRRSLNRLERTRGIEPVPHLDRRHRRRRLVK